MLHFVLCTSGECRDRGRGRQSDSPATFCAVYKWRVQGQGMWQAVWQSTDLLPAAQSVDVYSPGTQEEELTAVTDHRLVACLFSSKCLQHVIMDSGVLCPHPHDHTSTSWLLVSYVPPTYPQHGYWCLMSPPKKSDIPTSRILLSYVSTHMITYTHIMDSGVLCPHPHDHTYPHHGYWCLMSHPHTHSMDTGVLCPHQKSQIYPHHGYCCLMSPPTWSHIPTSWTLVSYVPSHMITYTHIMATIVLCPTHMITSWILVSYFPTHMIS